MNDHLKRIHKLTKDSPHEELDLLPQGGLSTLQLGWQLPKKNTEVYYPVSIHLF